MVDAAVLDKLEAGFAKLQASDSKSLLKKYLTKEIFDSLKNKKTPTFGSTLLDVIQSGLENHDSGVGIYAPDAGKKFNLIVFKLFTKIFPISFHRILHRLRWLVRPNHWRLPWWIQEDRQASSQQLRWQLSFRRLGPNWWICCVNSRPLRSLNARLSLQPLPYRSPIQGNGS